MSWTAAANFKIVDLRFRNTRADGTIMEAKNGAPIWYTELQLEGKADEWIGGLVFRSPAEWKGQVLALQFTTEEYQGRPRTKFRVASKAKPTVVSVLTEIRDLIIAGNEKRDQLIDGQDKLIELQNALIDEVQNLADVVRVAISNGG